MVFQDSPVSLDLDLDLILFAVFRFGTDGSAGTLAQHHPTLAEAAVQMKYYSSRDLREIQRIARLLPDEHVFRPKGKGAWKAKESTKYHDMWRKWLENKGMDLVIVFE